MSAIAPTSLSGPIVFFGDSLSDNGNLFDQTAGLVDEAVRQTIGGPNGQASNGATFAEGIDDLLGLPESVNYAVAGAKAEGTQRLGDFIASSDFADALIVPETDPGLDWDMNLGAQIDRFESDFAGQDLTGYTGFILIGGNDFGAIDGILDPAFVIAGVVDATLDAAQELLALGMDEVVVSSLPDADFFPTFEDNNFFDKLLIEGFFDLFHATLEDAIDDAENVRFLDMRIVSDAVVDDAAGFNLTAPYELTLGGGEDPVGGYDPDQVVFWDDLHPTAATHAILGAYTASALLDDPVAGGNGADLIVTAGDADLVFTYGGSDEIRSGDGDDQLFGGSDNDLMVSGNGADVVGAGSGNDRVASGAQDDIVSDGAGDDLVFTGGGADAILIGLGADTVAGGGGDDAFVFVEDSLLDPAAAASGPTRIIGGAGTDTLTIALSEETQDLFVDEWFANGFNAALNSIGIQASGIEAVAVVTGRDNLEGEIGEEVWYATADVWNFV